MDRWIGKVAVVTGASSGIGARIVKDLAKAGMIVVGLARRSERVDELWIQLKNENPGISGKIFSFKCDVSNEENIKAAFQWIDEKFSRVDILINNAGIFRKCGIVDADNSSKLHEVINTNVFGVAFCTREAFQIMKKYSINDGHICIMNSGAGHSVPFAFSQNESLNIYPSSKYAITAMTEVLRQEFQLLNTKIKITSISPGLTETEMVTPDLVEFFKSIDTPLLKPEDISGAILYVLGTPPHVQVHELMIRPVGEKF